ncbi:MAG: hypothetical protein KatS3mg031_0539 [Chitinophagales bacterium]|nr:MAG: hypothetical protein KatS3mg031_0539 [Chitinophagales bacterium]
MKEAQTLTAVARFHKTFHHPIKETPGIPSPERCQLRLTLLEEELSELQQAVEAGDIVQVADALCDLQYVLSGAVLEFGLGELFADLFEEVQRSNMSKACSSLDEALATMHFYETQHQTPCYYRYVDGRYLVYRKSDNKTLKSIRYAPAQLKEIIHRCRTKAVAGEEKQPDEEGAECYD